MNKAAVEQSLKNIRKCYSKKILTTNVEITNDKISWPNYKPGIIKGVCYPREYQLLLDQGQYSYLMFDGSFFQFYFEFNQGNLDSCRMAYYPVPKIIHESYEDLQEYETTANPWLREVFSEIALEMEFNSGQLSANSHVRFDFDKSVKTHSKAHLQFGGINDFRITAKTLVLPFAFCEKILFDFHPKWFEVDSDKNKTRAERNHSINNCYKFEEGDIYFISS